MVICCSTLSRNVVPRIFRSSFERLRRKEKEEKKNPTKEVSRAKIVLVGEQTRASSTRVIGMFLVSACKAPGDERIPRFAYTGAASMGAAPGTRFPRTDSSPERLHKWPPEFLGARGLLKATTNYETFCHRADDIVVEKQTPSNTAPEQMYICECSSCPDTAIAVPRWCPSR